MLGVARYLKCACALKYVHMVFRVYMCTCVGEVILKVIGEIGLYQTTKNWDVCMIFGVYSIPFMILWQGLSLRILHWSGGNVSVDWNNNPGFPPEKLFIWIWRKVLTFRLVTGIIRNTITILYNLVDYHVYVCISFSMFAMELPIISLRCIWKCAKVNCGGCITFFDYWEIIIAW